MLVVPRFQAMPVVPRLRVMPVVPDLRVMPVVPDLRVMPVVPGLQVMPVVPGLRVMPVVPGLRVMPVVPGLRVMPVVLIAWPPIRPFGPTRRCSGAAGSGRFCDSEAAKLLSRSISVIHSSRPLNAKPLDGHHHTLAERTQHPFRSQPHSPYI